MTGLMVYDFGRNWTLYVGDSGELEKQKPRLTFDKRLSVFRRNDPINSLGDLWAFRVNRPDAIVRIVAVK